MSGDKEVGRRVVHDRFHTKSKGKDVDALISLSFPCYVLLKILFIYLKGGGAEEKEDRKS